MRFFIGMSAGIFLIKLLLLEKIIRDIDIIRIYLIEDWLKMFRITLIIITINHKINHKILRFSDEWQKETD